MSIINVLAGNNYFIYNKTLAKNLGIESAIVLGFFANQFNYYQKNNQLKEIDGKQYFYATRETIYEETGLTEAKSRSATNLLKEKGILDIIKIGIPAKNYFYINENMLEKYLQSIETSSPAKNPELEVKNQDNLYLENSGQILNNINNNKDNINHIYSPAEETSTKKDELKQCIEYIVQYLNESVGTNYKATSKSTIKHISARFKEGYVLDDFYDVIDKKVKQWKNTEMEKYLRPETLFGTKFENYVNEKAKVFSGKAKTSYSSKPTFDNTKDHNVPKGIASMSKEEQKEFIDKELAKDENGNLLKF